jgi:hypothetical protein
MVIALQTPIVTNVANLAVTALVFNFGATDAQTVAQLSYAACNASGVVVAGAGSSTVTLTPTDIAAYNSAVGTPRQKAEAALQSNLGAVAQGTAV